ncbi:MAG TPA: DUF2752 domain-containing protein [Thermoanaerobaculia bacterium]|jgi:hypothetical protein|nr:DUF2752 domain-containing protein [Thermoanaerobaculia bacterium]
MTSPAARLWWITGLAGLAGLAILHVWVPSEDAASAICLSRRLLHLPCPGCGMTRAFAHLAKGEWSAALRDHPLSPVVAVELIAGWAAWGWTMTGRPFRLAVRFETLVLANVAALIALWLGRAAIGTLPW